MSGEHTPGPWEWRGTQLYSLAAKQTILRDVTFWNNRDEDKPLIAAAPETAAERDRLRAEVERLKEQLRPDSPTERAPTQWAYDQVCASYHKYRDEAESLRAEKAELVAAIKQIEVVCQDNAGAECNHAMALNFVRDVARTALAKVTATEGGA